MIFKLSVERYKLLKTIDFSEVVPPVVFDDIKHSVSVDDTQVRLFLIVISDEITDKGLTDDQQLATEYGRKLYGLYDVIYYQKQNKE